MKLIFENGIDNVTESITEIINSWKDGFYLSIDIDAVDPAFAPGTGYCEPGGLTSREILYMLQRVIKCKNHVSSDIVEVNPEKDVKNITSFLAAKIIKEIS
jgi:arginase family enzyme